MPLVQEIFQVRITHRWVSQQFIVAERLVDDKPDEKSENGALPSRADNRKVSCKLDIDGRKHPVFKPFGSVHSSHNPTPKPMTFRKRHQPVRIWRPGRRRRMLHVQTLESRRVLAVAINIDYTFDTQGFFSQQERRDAMEEVAAVVSSRLGDSFDAIVPSGGNTWSQRFTHPGNGISGAWVSNPTVAADEYVIYVGGREQGGSTLGRGGPGGFSASGNTTWFNAIRQRGQPGVANDTDFARWGGAISFDSVGTNWHFGDSTVGLGSGEFDFRSVAYHELLHAIGFGTSDSYDAHVAAGEFTGPNAVAEYDLPGNVPLHGDPAHFASGTQDGGQETAMDPGIAPGLRKFPTPLDWAVMSDIGWEVSSQGVYYSGDDLIVNGTNDVNLIEVRAATGGVRVLIDGVDHGVWSAPPDQLVVNALSGNDEVRFEPAVPLDSTINGGSGNDFLRGGAGQDAIYGGPGNDRIYGRDNIDMLFGQSGADRLFGMNGADSLDGGSGIDVLIGAEGNDTLIGGSEADRLSGGNGNDTLRGGSGDDNLTGGNGADNLFGDEDNDTIRGSAGDDTIEGGNGDDTIFGGGDSDTIRGQQGADDIQGNGGNDFIYGGSGNDDIGGGSGNDFIDAGDGNDIVAGASGVDQIFGGIGIDDINGGSGNDIIDAGGGNDTVNGSTGDDEIRGGSGDDILNGGNGNDQLFGDDGDDDLFGSNGDDMLTGGPGLDRLHGGAGFDTALDDGERGEISIESS